MYTERYYKEANYANYLERKDRYFRLAKEVSTLLDSLSLIKTTTSIVDFGCAVGHLMDGMLRLGYTNIVGIDISDWALGICKQSNLVVYNTTNNIKSDMMFALDVFEHMEDKDIIHTITSLDPKVIVARIPIAKNKGEDYFLEVSRNDKTHINCKTKEEWIELFSLCGIRTFLSLNLNTIYDSTGVFSTLLLR